VTPDGATAHIELQKALSEKAGFFRGNLAGLSFKEKSYRIRDLTGGLNINFYYVVHVYGDWYAYEFQTD